MVCCDSISHAEQISRISPRPTWTRSLYGSINVHGRPWDSKLLPIDYEWCCSDQLNPPSKADMGRRILPVISAASDPEPTLADFRFCSAAISHIGCLGKIQNNSGLPKGFCGRTGRPSCYGLKNRSSRWEREHGSSPGLFESKERRALILLRRGTAHGRLRARRRRPQSGR